MNRKDFQFEIFKEAIKKNPSNNTVLSPISLLFPLAILSKGAKGQTLAELQKVLNDSTNKNIYLENLNQIFTSIKDEQCLKIANALFMGEFDKLTLQELDLCFKQFISFPLPKEIKLCDFLVENKIIESKRAFRELVTSNSLFVNQTKIEDFDFMLTKENSYFNKYTIVKKGKKKYYIIM